MNADEVSENDDEEGAEEEDGSGEGGPSEEGNGQAQSVSCTPLIMRPIVTVNTCP